MKIFYQLTIQWRSNKIDFDRNLLSWCFKTCHQRFFHSINAFITVASALDVGTNLHRLRCQLPLDIREQHILRVFIEITLVEEGRLKHSLLEDVIRCCFVLVLLFEVPSSLWYNSSSCSSVSYSNSLATWRNIEFTAFALLNRSVHFSTSSGDTRRFERSM